MDMRKHLRILITLDVLEAMGTYIGTITEVVVETVNNKKKGRRMKVPHIYFEDGHFLIPNEGNKKCLIAGYGPETDAWIGKRVGIYTRQQEFEASPLAAYEKVMECLDAVESLDPLPGSPLNGKTADEPSTPRVTAEMQAYVDRVAASKKRRKELGLRR